MKIGPFEVKYEAGHSYEETWEKSDLLCPQCTSDTIWEESGLGDYYLGNPFLCLTCGIYFYMPIGPAQATNWQWLQRIQALKAETAKSQE